MSPSSSIHPSRDGVAAVRKKPHGCLRADRPGRYQVQAAIQAVHAVAPTAAATDWPRIVALYDLLRAIDPSPTVALHRAVAVAEVDGPAPALVELDVLALDRHPLWHAVRGDLLARLGRTPEAKAALAAAIARTDNAAEQRHLARALARLG